MKLSRIEISNVLGLHRADLDIATPITMVMGSNEAGKSSLRDAVAMAMIGSPVRVKLKKEYGQLLHDDAKKGRVSLLADGEELATFKLPGGEQVCAKFAGQDFIEHVISPELTAKMTPADLRSMLFALTRCKASVDVRAQMLLDRGCNAIMVEAFKPMLRGPFPDCAKDAAERATQCKGAWRGITGENWGKDKAQAWKPEAVGPAPTQEAIDAARADHARIQESIDKGTKYLGGLEQRQKETQGLAARRRELEDLAGSLKRATGKKEATDKDLSQWEIVFADVAEKIKVARAGAVTVKCPCCDERLRIVGQSLEKYDGAEVDPKLLTELNTELVKAQNAVSMLGRTQHNDAQAIIAAQNATTELGILQQTAEPVAPEAIHEAHEALNMLRQDRDKARAKVQALEGLAADVASAKDREARAGMAHNECMEWLKISDALSPGGIPAEILSTALKPVNDSLAILARLSGWKPVQITDDMQIVVGGRLYGLQSESSKWRADTLLALAITQISELRFVLLDRFDVLDQAGRKQLIGTLMQLTTMGAIDQALICGTLKEPTKGMPTVIGQVWVSRGIAEAVA